jgi:integrase
MALNDVRLRTLKPAEKAYCESDGGGLHVEILPTGKKRWGLKYRAANRKQETVRLGDYPTYSLAEARSWRDECKALVKRGLSPMALKRGDPIPAGVSPAVKEMAEAFVSKWCLKARELAKAREDAAREDDTVRAFAWRWYEEIAAPANRNPRNIERILKKDVIPVIGEKRLAEVTPDDVLMVTDRIKHRGADQMALQTRNVLKRMFAYAIARQKTQFNPAAAIEARFIAQARSRDVALTAEEIGRLMRAIYRSSMKRSHKLALHLLILCMVRKSELIEARWEEIDFDRAEWAIPAERMKKDRPHLVPLSRQALAMFEELRDLASGSEWVFPSRGDLHRPISKSTLNVAVRALEVDVRDFVLHDFRRTASTHLHEQGFNSDWIEKALAHEQKWVRGVYNRAEYLAQRRQMLQWWADFVDSQIREDVGRVIIGPFGKAFQSAA